jgi:hypothetical protein
MTTRRAFAGLIVRKECWVLSPAARVLILAIVISAIAWVRWQAYPFLATNHPLDTDTLVVEGWISEATVKNAAAEFVRGKYRRVVVMRGLYEPGQTGIDGRSCDDELGFRLSQRGVPKESLTTVFYAASQRDRTYHSALAAKDWFSHNGGIPTSMNIATEGAHARRSWLLYQKAFQDVGRIGIVVLDNPTYDAKHWWRSSEGVREVLGETIAYVYARFFFGWTATPSEFATNH